ncbi:MAG: sigma-70 family RNA polymerase sigma factor [Pirellulales bacterium]
MTDHSPYAGANASDRLLLLRLRSGEGDAATDLYLRYADRLLNLARRQTPADLASRFDPEDVVQSVFRTFFRRFSAGAYDVPDGGELWKLLLVISLNKLRKLGQHHRAQKRDVRRTIAGDEVGRVPGMHDEGAVAHLKVTIDELLQSLDEHATRIIELRMEGREVQEIATAVGRSKRTVERVLQGFRQRLAEEIGEVTNLADDSDAQ